MSGFAAYPRAAEWLFGVLTSPAITGIDEHVYEDQAPEAVTDADTTWIAFESLDDGSDLMEVGAHRIWTEFPIQVAAFRRGRSTKALTAIADEIDDRLHRASGAVSDGQVISCVRTGEVQEPYLKQGVEYRALGGLYNLLVQPLNP